MSVGTEANPRVAAKTILVVDDEPDILRLIDTVLSARGYIVVLAKGADNAIKHFERMSKLPDLVLTDVVMPGTSGPMMVDHLLTIDPNIRVLFMSGYDERQIVQKYVVEKGFVLLPKPFTPAALASTVRDVLSGMSPGGRAESGF